MTKEKYYPGLVFFLSLCLITSYSVYAQTIRYSRQTVTLPEYDRMQLITDIAGNHHLLFFKRNKTPLLYIFDRDLQLIAKKKPLETTIDSIDKQVITFKNHYLLYLHKKGSTKHQLWKITGQGEAHSLSDPFQNLIDSVFKKKTSTLQLINKDEQLAIISNVYYEELKALATTVVIANEQLKVISAPNISLPFNPQLNWLSQTLIIGDYLFVLKIVREGDHQAIELIKANIITGKLLRKTFETNVLARASLHYNSIDSNLLIQAFIGRQIFVSKLDFSLKELLPVTELTPAPSNGFVTHFFLLDGEVQQWLLVNSPNPSRQIQSNTTSNTSMPRLSNSLNELPREAESRAISLPDVSPDMRTSVELTRRQDQYISSYRNSSNSYGPYTYPNSSLSGRNRSYPVQNLTSPLRFSVFNKDFKLTSDSLVKNDKNPAIITNGQFARITAGHQSCLIFRQELPRSKKGLLLVSAERNNKIVTRDISVYDKYEYLLQFAQTINNETLIIPYLEKDNIGLVSLSFANENK